MLENNIESRDVEIAELKLTVVQKKSDIEALSSTSVRNRFVCEDCDFVGNTKESLSVHIEKDHRVKCEHCGESFLGSAKLKQHMCRIHVKNPSYSDSYMKNWFIKNDCIRVFSATNKSEIAIVHSEVCVEKHRCSWVLKDFISQLRYIDNTDLIHLHTSEFLLDGMVQWEILTELLDVVHNY